MGRPKLYDNATERKRAQRSRQRARLQGQASDTARLVALQENFAPLHIVVHGRTPHLQKQATAEQRRLQEERKERDMLDALWTLQTLIADFGYDEVYTHLTFPISEFGLCSCGFLVHPL